MIVPGGGVLLPSSCVPGVCPGGWFWIKLVPALTSKSCVKRTCWDTRATDSIIKSGQKDTKASIS